MANATSAQQAASAATATATFETSFNHLKQSVSSADAVVFQSTSLEEVWKAAEEIEAAQRQRKSLRNMRRLEPFLNVLEKYSKSIEILCNGTPYLPWIWAPIKLMLQLASEYNDVFDKLLDAYKQIAEAMPQFDRLQGSFQDDPNFRVVLGMVYSDILEFHRRAYNFFRRRSWHIFFDSLWKSFEARFHGILKNLARHKKLLLREVTVIDLVEARESRLQVQEELARQEKRSLDYYLHDSIAWLKVADEQLDDDLEKLSERRQKGTCEWIFKNQLLKKWKDDAHTEPIIWIKGIPGAGKTILSTFIIRRLQEETRFTTIFHICNSYTTGKNLLGELLRSLTVQLLKANVELAPYIFENYANKGLSPSIVRLRRLLPELITTVSSTRIIVDGLDEYPESDQRLVLTELMQIVKLPGGQCRILFSNREGTQLTKVLGAKPTISLRDEYNDINEDIKAYVHASLEDFRPRFGDRLVNKTEGRIFSKANGMFLWVRLVVRSLEQCYSGKELEDAVDTLPEGLDAAYGRILKHVMQELTPQSRKKAIRILEWIACSFRTLKVHEIQDGIFFHTSESILDEHTKLRDGFLELCKPLIEESQNNTVDFVHYSAREYILHISFLHHHQAHYDISFSCMTYLASSFCFIDPEYSEDELKVRILHGFHGLHHYANEFWFQHVLQYAKCENIVDDDNLEEPLEGLQDFWKGSPGEGASALKLEDTTSADSIEAELEVLNDMPLAQEYGLDILTFGKFLSQERYSHQDPQALKKTELEHDPTHFSSISQRYQNLVHSLLASEMTNLPSGISAAQFEEFRSKYTDSAFICSYRDCPRHSDGFRSSSERDSHESLHAKPLRCADPSCDFFARGFASKTGLAKHNKKYHSLGEESVPEFEPRKELLPEPQKEPSPEPQKEPSPEPLPTIIEQPISPREKTLSPTPPTPVVEAEPIAPVQQRKPKERVSRARRGQKVHKCNLCNKVFTRNEGLERHQLSHFLPRFICTWEGCNKAFYRNDLLQRHFRRHNSSSLPQIDDPLGSTRFE